MNEWSPIQLQVDPRWAQQVDAPRLAEAVRHALEGEVLPDNPELSLVIVGDEEMARLHEAYRADPTTTDVLTFPYDDEGVDEEMASYLGDVIVCYEQAARQAEEEGHSVGDELVLLAVHGTLHLLGYDDESPEEKAEMWERQRDIMEGIGLAQIAPR